VVRLGEIVLIHDLKRQGLTITAIARQVGLDWKTVRRYLQRGLEPPAYKSREPVPRLIAGFEDYLRERVSAFPDLSGKRLLREIRGLGYQGGYTGVTDFLRDVRPPRRPQFERRFGTPPGRQAQVDFAEFKVEFDDEPGVMRKVCGFAEWGEVVRDPVVATALLDRLLHHAVVIQIEGASYRLVKPQAVGGADAAYAYLEPGLRAIP
jgi:transposase